MVVSATIARDHEPKLSIFPGKQTGIAPLEQEVTMNMQKQSRTRVKCGRIESVTGRHVCCSQYHARWYCSKLCQQEHWGEHKILCEARREMETLKQSSAKGEEELIMSFPAHLTPPQHSKLTKLVRRRCIVSCLLQGKKVDALWDTGAQVCIISKSRKDTYLPDVPERDKSELLGEHELDLQVANGTAFLYDGRIEVEFQLVGEYGQSEPITVPLLVGRRDNQEYLIIGFNVIEEVVKQGSSIGTKHGVTCLVQTAFPCLSEGKRRFLANFMLKQLQW